MSLPRLTRFLTTHDSPTGFLVGFVLILPFYYQLYKFNKQRQSWKEEYKIEKEKLDKFHQDWKDEYQMKRENPKIRDESSIFTSGPEPPRRPKFISFFINDRSGNSEQLTRQTSTSGQDSDSRIPKRVTPRRAPEATQLLRRIEKHLRPSRKDLIINTALSFVIPTVIPIVLTSACHLESEGMGACHSGLDAFGSVRAIKLQDTSHLCHDILMGTMLSGAAVMDAAFLKKIGVIETPQCWWCGQAEQSVEHPYTKCRIWRKERRKLLRNLYKEGIRWQGWTERKGLAELLADGKALGPLVGFSKSADLGGGEGVKERELEWERRDDQVGEELLTD